MIQGISTLIESGYYNPDQYEPLPLVKPSDTFVTRIQQDKLFPLIAEVKFSSPTFHGLEKISEHEKRYHLQSLIQANVTGVSILTEPNYFHGKLEYLRKARKMNFRIPLLMKDIIISQKQILCAKKLGASTVILLAKIFDLDTLIEYVNFAKNLGLEVLVEVNTEKEMLSALKTTCDLIGINNRDLTTFVVDLGTTEHLLKKFQKPDRPILALSGIHTSEDAKRMKDAGADGILVGTAITESQDPKVLINQLRGV